MDSICSILLLFASTALKCTGVTGDLSLKMKNCLLLMNFFLINTNCLTAQKGQQNLLLDVSFEILIVCGLDPLLCVFEMCRTNNNLFLFVPTCTF